MSDVPGHRGEVSACIGSTACRYAGPSATPASTCALQIQYTWRVAPTPTPTPTLQCEDQLQQLRSNIGNEEGVTKAERGRVGRNPTTRLGGSDAVGGCYAGGVCDAVGGYQCGWLNDGGIEHGRHWMKRPPSQSVTKGVERRRGGGWVVGGAT